MVKKINHTDIGKEFIIRLLPNYDDPIHPIISYNKTFNGSKFYRFGSAAIINGEYSLFIYTLFFKNLIEKILYGEDFYISNQNGISDQNEFGNKTDSFIKTGSSIDPFSLESDVSIKFTVNHNRVNNKYKLITYNNIELIRSDKNILWDGNYDNAEPIKKFLKNKNWELKEETLEYQLSNYLKIKNRNQLIENILK